MVTSVSMRRGFVKVKRMPPASERPIHDDDDLIGEKAKPSRPFLAMRAIPQVPPKPWWSNWRTIALISGFLFVTVFGIYLLSKADKLRSDRPPEATANNSSTSRRGGAGFMPGKGNPGDTTWGSTADYSAPTAESFRATYGGLGKSSDVAQAPTQRSAIPPGNKLVLDRNISGNCTIGTGQIQDFYDCLTRASAKSAQRSAQAGN